MTGLYGMRFGPKFRLALANHFAHAISVSEAVVLGTSDLGQGMHKICMYKCLWV